MWFMWSLTSCLKDARGRGLKIENWNVPGQDFGFRLRLTNHPQSTDRWLSIAPTPSINFIGGSIISRVSNNQLPDRQVAASSQVVLKEWPARCPIPGPDSCNLSESLLWGNNINLAINNGRLSDGSYHCDLNEDWHRYMIKLLSKWGVQQVIW